MKHIITIALLLLVGLSANAGDLADRLRKASKSGDLDTVKILIDAGVPLNTQYGTLHWTALMHAAANGHMDIIPLLEVAE